MSLVTEQQYGHGRIVKMFIYNPRIFRKLIELLRKYDITFTVVDDPCLLIKDHSKQEILIIDDETLEMIKDICHINSRAQLPTDLVVIRSYDDIHNAISKSLGINLRDVMIAGVDIGKRLAYAIIMGDLLLDFGYADSADDLVSIIKEAKSKFMPAKTIVRVGKPVTQELQDVMFDVIQSCLKEGLEVFVVDEEKSSSEISGYMKPALRGLSIPRDKNIRAAIALALRRGRSSIHYYSS